MFNVTDFNVEEFDRILSCGLSQGLGERGIQICIEAAICQVLGLPHSDDPGCVAEAVRWYKIRLNDSNWSSPQTRAIGLRDLGLAQLGSKDIVDDVEFSRRLAEKTIHFLIPTLFRELFPDNKNLLAAADRCEKESTDVAASAAADAAACASVNYAAKYAAYSASNSAYAAAYAATNTSVNYAANAARAAADAADLRNGVDAYAGEKYLQLSAKLALDVLIELQSPGVALLGERK